MRIPALLKALFLIVIIILPVIYVMREGKVKKIEFQEITIMWSYEIEGAQCSSPALGDVDNDGKIEVVIGACDGYVYVLNGEDGSLVWRRRIGPRIFSSPSLGDIDDDNRLEIIIGSWDGYLYALNGEDGSLLWKYWTKYPVYPSPVLWDIDNDKNLEIVISWGVYVYALDLPKAGKRICWQGFAGFDFSRRKAFIDSDKDGLGDYEEKIVGTNPNNPDTDDDGMSDHWEVFYNLNPADPR